MTKQNFNDRLLPVKMTEAALMTSISLGYLMTLAAQ
jgi:hypothetical protein